MYLRDMVAVPLRKTYDVSHRPVMAHLVVDVDIWIVAPARSDIVGVQLVNTTIERSIENARQKGFVETIFHRKRFLPDINSHNATVRGYAERNAINAPIQGSAADIIKVAMARIGQRFADERLRSKMILQVHDELNFSVPADERERVQQIVIEEMENACPMRVPLKADYGWGSNWLEAH